MFGIFGVTSKKKKEVKLKIKSSVVSNHNITSVSLNTQYYITIVFTTKFNETDLTNLKTPVQSNSTERSVRI